MKEKVITKLSMVKCYVIPDTKGISIQPLILDEVTPGSTLMSDEWMAYNGMDKYYNHGVVVHGRGE